MTQPAAAAPVAPFPDAKKQATAPSPVSAATKTPLAPKASPARQTGTAIDIAAEVEKAVAKASSAWGREKAEMERKHAEKISALEDRLTYGDDTDRIVESRAKRAIQEERQQMEQGFVDAHKELLLAQGVPAELVSDIDSLAGARVASKFWFALKEQLQASQKTPPEAQEPAPPAEHTANPGNPTLGGPGSGGNLNEQMDTMANKSSFDLKRAMELVGTIVNQ